MRPARASLVLVSMMPRRAAAPSSERLGWIISTFALLLGESAGGKSQIFYMDTDCDKSVLLGGATVYSHHGADVLENYADRIDCRITFRAENDSWKLMLRVEQLDIPDTSYNKVQLCNDALYVYDAKNIFGRAVSEAGGTGGLCGSALPSVIYSTGPYLTAYFRTDAGGLSGHGFKLVITAYNEDYAEFKSCGEAFHCSNHLCISKELLCDGVNNCADSSDELATEPANCGEGRSFIHKILSLGVAAAIAITVGTIVVVVVVIVCIVCCCCRCTRKRAQDPAHSTTTTTATSVTINNGAPPVVAHHPYNPLYVQQGYYPVQSAPPSVNATNYSPYPQRDSNPCAQEKCAYPPSYHQQQQQHHHQQQQSYTPPSSKSGRSHQSSDNMVRYQQRNEKLALPVSL